MDRSTGSTAPGLRIVLVSPRNPLNIGAAARAMSNFGFTDLRLVNPYDLAFKEARSAVRSRYILERAQVVSTIQEATAGCTHAVGTTALGNRDLHVPLIRLERAARLIRGRLKTSSVALLFGSEKFGLSNEDLSHCQWVTRIPTREEHGSMNLGQAVAICLYELRRDAAAARIAFEPRTPAPAEELNRLTGVLLDVLARSGYVQDRSVMSAELKTRRLIRRLRLSASDADVWTGMFRQVLWKLNRNAVSSLAPSSDAILNPDDEGAGHV
jgi:tRNA/rRNA methyltransferase